MTPERGRAARIQAEAPPLVLSPLQNKFGVTPIATVHYVASAAFLVALAWISWQFGRREGDRRKRVGMKRSPSFWRWFHRGCAVAMGLALLWVVAGGFAHVARATLIGEWVCAIAFGASWFWKGFELDTLRGHPAQVQGREESTTATPLDSRAATG